MVKLIKNSAKITVQVAILSIASFIIFAIAMGIFGDAGEFLVGSNPLFSGFIHLSMDHILFNLLLIFIFTLPSQNSSYNIRKIYWITFIISCAYLPISLLGITEYAVGISGTCYFLASRFFFSPEGNIIKRIFLFSIFSFLLLGEFINMTKPISDGVAHGVHFMGVLLGIFSLYIKPNLITPKIRSVIL
jgi:hypothetical protein